MQCEQYAGMQPVSDGDHGLRPREPDRSLRGVQQGGRRREDVYTSQSLYVSHRKGGYKRSRNPVDGVSEQR